MTSPSHIEIDLPAIERNVGVVRRAASMGVSDPEPPAGPAAPAKHPAICAVLKADAYALGAPRIAKRLKIAGVKMLAVYTPAQARDLVEAAVDLPILVLMPIDDLDRSHSLYRAVSSGQVHFAVHSEEGRRALAEIADRQGVTIPVHLEVDTGMARAGVRLDEAGEVLSRIASHKRLKLTGLHTHFAAADTDASLTQLQGDRFASWLRANASLIPPGCVVHQANSFALFRRPGLSAQMVRVGLALMGYACEELQGADDSPVHDLAGELTPAVRWLAPIVHTARLAVGATVGYGATWAASRPTRIASVPVGYADGYPLALSNKARVGVVGPDGARAFVPLIGRVSMDQVTIDITDVPESWLDGRTTKVELIGADPTAPTHLPVLARAAGTITHELLCRLSPRLERRYIAVQSVPAEPRVAAVRTHASPAGTPAA